MFINNDVQLFHPIFLSHICKKTVYMKFCLLNFTALLLAFFAKASSDTVTIPIARQYFHDKVAIEQKLCDKADGKYDNQMRIGNNEEVNIRVTDVLYRKVNLMKDWIESNEIITKNNDKIRLLNYLESTLRNFRKAWKNKEIAPGEFPMLAEQVFSIIKAQENDASIVPYVKQLSYPLAKIITTVFSDNKGFRESEKIVYFKYCTLHPDIILSTIRPFVNEPFADSLLAIACAKNPSQLYTYAQSVNTPEGKLIHKSNNFIVNTVAKLSQTPNALMYFPFLDDILSGKKTVESIKNILGTVKMVMIVLATINFWLKQKLIILQE
jgi:hypothetical protein